MSISTKSELIAAALRWTKQQAGDIESESLDDFILLSEAHVNTTLRTQDMTFRMITLTMAGQFVYPLPADSAGLRNVELQTSGGRHPLEYYTPEALDEEFGGIRGQGTPIAYTLTGYDIELQPCPNDEYPLRVIFYQTIPPLTDADSTNWLLTKQPMVYLYGVLHFMMEYVRDDEAAGYWANKFEGAVKSLQESDETDRWSGSAPSVKNL